MNGVGYNVVHRLINASDYRVPQNRQRVLFVGVRKDLNITFVFPDKQSKDGLTLGFGIFFSMIRKHSLYSIPRESCTPRLLPALEKGWQGKPAVSISQSGISSALTVIISRPSISPKLRRSAIIEKKGGM